MLQGWTLGHNHNVINAECKIVKCWPEVAGTLAAGDRHQNYACPDALTASPPSPSFPRSPPDLSVAGPVVPCDITVQSL